MPETITIDQQLDELERERAMRKRVYPRLISTGRMTAEEAQMHLDRLAAAIKTLDDVRAERQAKVNPGLF
jgi:hypothetical protein